MNKKILLSWAAYDWANSAINTIVFTFVFSVYFARSIYGDEVNGSAAWSFAQGCAGVAVALISPFAGASIDAYGPRKPALKLLTLSCLCLCAGLFFMRPGTSYIYPALVLGALLTLVFETVQTFYASTLPLVAKDGDIGRVSGIGWGAGYLGSILSLSIALFAFIGMGDAQGWLGLQKEDALHVRSTMLMAALWYALFAIPYFAYCPDAPKSGATMAESVRSAVWGIRQTLRAALRVKGVPVFLLASALYRDGLVTLFAVGGLYAAGTLGMSFSEVVIFAIAINIAAGAGAIGFALFDDRVGSKTTVMISLAALVLLGAGVIAATDKHVFIALSCLLGVFIGPVQASSRALLAKLCPPEQAGAFFGLYALTGKSVAFMGPFCFAALTALTHSQRAGMASILAFWLTGLFLLCFVRSGNDRRV